MTAPQEPSQASPTKRKFSRRASIIGGILALAILAGVGWLAWYLTHRDTQAGNGGPGGLRGRPTTTVGVATAERADIPVILEALGTITTSATATVRPQVSGVLQKVLFTEGQMIKAGQTLAVIDPRPFELALMQASGQRQRDEAQLENAKLTLQRYRTLLEQDSIARQDVDTQAALVKQLEGTVATDRANEGTAKLNLGYSSIVAPISGRIGLRNADIGNVVNTSDTNGIAVITQQAPIDVVFAVPQDRVPELRARINENAELPVTVLDRNRSDVLDTGRFLALDNQVDTQTGTVRAKGRFTNEKSVLFPSQFVNVRLLLRTIKGALVVPITALRHSGKGDYVYALNATEKTVALRPVQRGQATVDKVEIVSGLTAGEQVITEGADRLKDGARVTLPGDKPAYGKGGEGKKRKRDGDAAGAASTPASASTSTAAGATSGETNAASSGEKRNAGGPATGTRQIPSSAAPHPAKGAPAAGSSGPTPAQRQGMLDKVKDDPEALARRKAFLEKIDQGDPEAIERWQRMQERLRQGGQGSSQ